jgi:hypothetical protein
MGRDRRAGSFATWTWAYNPSCKLTSKPYPPLKRLNSTHPPRARREHIVSKSSNLLVVDAGWNGSRRSVSGWPAFRRTQSRIEQDTPEWG